MNGDEVQLLERRIGGGHWQGGAAARQSKADWGTSHPKRVFHLMAKAAVAVLEAVADEND